MARLMCALRQARRLIGLSVVANLLLACATTEPPEKLAASWEGQKLELVIAAWGEPDWKQTYDSKLYYGWTWRGEGSGVVTLPDVKSATPPVRGSGQHNERTRVYCERVVQVDGANVVRQATFNGDGCQRFARGHS